MSPAQAAGHVAPVKDPLTRLWKAAGSPRPSPLCGYPGDRTNSDRQAKSQYPNSLCLSLSLSRSLDMYALRQVPGWIRQLSYPHGYVSCPTHPHGYRCCHVVTPPVTRYSSDLRSWSKSPQRPPTYSLTWLRSPPTGAFGTALTRYKNSTITGCLESGLLTSLPAVSCIQRNRSGCLFPARAVCSLLQDKDVNFHDPWAGLSYAEKSAPDTWAQHRCISAPKRNCTVQTVQVTRISTASAVVNPAWISTVRAFVKFTGVSTARAVR